MHGREHTEARLVRVDGVGGRRSHERQECARCLGGKSLGIESFGRTPCRVIGDLIDAGQVADRRWNRLEAARREYAACVGASPYGREVRCCHSCQRVGRVVDGRQDCPQLSRAGREFGRGLESGLMFGSPVSTTG